MLPKKVDLILLLSAQNNLTLSDIRQTSKNTAYFCSMSCRVKILRICVTIPKRLYIYQ